MRLKRLNSRIPVPLSSLDWVQGLKPVRFSMIKGTVFVATSVHTLTPAPIAEDHTLFVGALVSPSNTLTTPLPTPLRPQNFARYLANHPDKAFVSRLIDGLTKGFDIGHNGPRHGFLSPNLPSSYEHPSVIDKHLLKECQAERIAGPFDTLPFANLQCSGMGVVPKKDGKWRVINHLSAPCGQSVNDYINPEEFSLRYTSVDDAVNICSKLGPGTLLAKIDLENAFRQCPVREADYHLLGMQWRGKFYYDKCLPFGLRSAPYLFNLVATALDWIIKDQSNSPYVLHYLDDFLFAGPANSNCCKNILEIAQSVCSHVGVTIKTEKSVGPTTTITFLGIQIDTLSQTIRVPQEKLNEILIETDALVKRKKCTKRELLSIIGKLSFAAKAIPAGRIFIRRLIDTSMKTHKLHHYVNLNTETRADLQWWLDFASSWNGQSFFLEPIWTPSTQFDLFTDASGSIGYGAYWRGNWLSSPWQTQHVNLSIEWKELYAIVVAAMTWGHAWKSKKLIVHCDNHAVVDIWHSHTSRSPLLMKLVRKLFFTAASYNFNIIIQHIPGIDNSIADALSRSQMARFRSLAPEANPLPSVIPAHVMSL